MSLLRLGAEILPSIWPLGRLNAAVDKVAARGPRRSAKDRAIEVARIVLKYEQAAISITPSETILLAREYLKALGLKEIA